MEFEESEVERICKNVYKTIKHSKGFGTKDELAKWWANQISIQNNCCDYCKTSIQLIKELIKNNLLKGRRVKGNGIRGPQLELERLDPEAGYSPNNCVLICYYCNNDKSNVYTTNDYKLFHAPGKNKHFLHLKEKLVELKMRNS